MSDVDEHIYFLRGLFDETSESGERCNEIAYILSRLRAEVAALRAHDPLAEMWAALVEYQEQADRDGHGESWRNMCELRTVNAALDASGFTRGWSANATMWVGLSLSYRGTNAEKSAQHASEAIDSIRRAKEALHWIKARTNRREAQGTEGTHAGS
jgi:hypothetical protein